MQLSHWPHDLTSCDRSKCRLLLRFYHVGRDILDLDNKAAESSHLVNAWARLYSRQFSAAHGASIQLVIFLIGPTRRLKLLEIAGLRAVVDVDPTTALAALHSVAEVVEFVENPPQDLIEESRVDYQHVSQFGLDYFQQPQSTARARWVAHTLPRTSIV